MNIVPDSYSSYDVILPLLPQRLIFQSHHYTYSNTHKDTIIRGLDFVDQYSYVESKQ